MLRQSDLTEIPDALKWKSPKLEPDESFIGILAGPIQAIRTHTLRNISKPCVRYLSHGKLKCVCDERTVNTRMIGYMPLFGKEGERHVYILSAETVKKHCGIKPGDLVKVVKPKKVKQPLTVMHITGHAAMQEWVLKLKPYCNQDIEEYLCHLWQFHALTRFLGHDVRRSIKCDAVLPPAPELYMPRFAPDYVPGYETRKPDAEAA